MSNIVSGIQNIGNLVNNYKDVTEKVGCKVPQPMTNPQPTDTGIFSNLEKCIENRYRFSVTSQYLLESILRSSDSAQQEVLQNFDELQDEVNQ